MWWRTTAPTFARVSVGAVPMLKLFGIVAGGWQLLRSALISQHGSPRPEVAAPILPFTKPRS